MATINRSPERSSTNIYLQLPITAQDNRSPERQSQAAEANRIRNSRTRTPERPRQQIQEQIEEIIQ